MTSPLPSISGLADLAVRYDAVLSDVWGVVHNGVEAFPSAVQALAEFRKAGGKVVFITNAPRPSGPIIEMLDRLGVHREAYDAIVSSGDATRAMIAKYSGRAIHHVGPATEDDALYEGLGVRRAGADEAEVVVVTDLDTDDDTPEMYRERARHWLSRKLPMICANPDHLVERGDDLVYCAGALAAQYEREGGGVVYAGKPYPPIYLLALETLSRLAGREIKRSEVLAIGDGVNTDIAGAAALGIGSVFVASGLHVPANSGGDAGSEALDPRHLAELFAQAGRPLAAMQRLAW